MAVVEPIRSRQRRRAGFAQRRRCAEAVEACYVRFNVYGLGGENKQMKQSSGISTVYGVARRRRRCSSATRVLLVTAERNAVGETAAAV